MTPSNHVLLILCVFILRSVETEEKCESTREAGLTGVSLMSGGQPVPWK